MFDNQNDAYHSKRKKKKDIEIWFGLDLIGREDV